ncbi:S8 family peptidase [Polaromonas sp. JS666]|uniref:S8 family peptidase n=1 Tax=Polaromonas sp. (strain JS666 / ATCC BAA-500) TaxID=296591 RepID=UPI00004645CE|nr:S8 family peptidase [Polaromonas sp. JS666]ABE43771.1 peptidase S8 and S53, subtilisin, kexin, sedolisin [Polaromonas sp. JS666]
MKKTLLTRLLALSVYATALAIGAPAALAQAVDPPATHPYAQSQPIPGRYIVVFKDSVANPAAEAANLTRGLGGQLHHTYTSALKGFAASLPDAALQGIRNNPNVDYIEQDQTVSLNEAKLSSTQVQSTATWGLDRIDQTDRPLDTWYHYNYTGAGVNAFIIDTGILATHTDFQGRVQSGYTAITDNNSTNDCNGHGTHVAGTVGGLTWGVAKGVALIPVRVLDCSGSGTWSGVIAGINWVIGQATKSPNPLLPAVANMSLGGGASPAVDTAVANAVNNGVTMVVAAGNSSADACRYSPAREPSAITVGATTSSDKRAFYSNYGKCLDLFAPGSSITSASISSNDASTIKSGTSMASPHVAGVAALALAEKPATLPAGIASFLTDNATRNKLGSIGRGSPNLLVYSLGTTWASTSVAISSITDSTLSGRNGWNASATVTVRKRNSDWSIGDPAAGATVTGSFSPGGSVSCVTDPSGSCTLTSSIIRSTDSAKVTVTGISGPLMTYDASQNAVTEIVIAKP